MNHVNLGNVLIDRIVESENADIDPTVFFPDTTLEDWALHRDWLQPKAMDANTGILILPIQSYLIRTKHHIILVDTYVGDHKKKGTNTMASAFGWHTIKEARQTWYNPR